MSKTPAISLIIFVITCFSADVYSQNLSARQKSVIEDQITTEFQNMLKAATTLDLKTLATGVDDRYHAGFISNGTYYSTFDSLMSVLEKVSGSVIRQDFSVEMMKISVLSENFALLTALGTAEVSRTSGNMVKTKFYWTFVYQKIDGAWKVIRSHQSGNRV